MLPGLHKSPEEMRKAESCSHPGAAARGLGAGDLTGSVTAWEWVLSSVPFIPTGSQVALAPPGSALPFVPGEHMVLFQKVRLLLACAGACGAPSSPAAGFQTGSIQLGRALARCWSSPEEPNLGTQAAWRLQIWYPADPRVISESCSLDKNSCV